MLRGSMRVRLAHEGCERLLCINPLWISDKKKSIPVGGIPQNKRHCSPPQMLTWWKQCVYLQVWPYDLSSRNAWTLVRNLSTEQVNRTLWSHWVLVGGAQRSQPQSEFSPLLHSHVVSCSVVKFRPHHTDEVRWGQTHSKFMSSHNRAGSGR